MYCLVQLFIMVLVKNRQMGKVTGFNRALPVHSFSKNYSKLTSIIIPKGGLVFGIPAEVGETHQSETRRECLLM